MTQASKRKVEFILADGEVGAFFRKLGDAMDQGTLQVGDTSLLLENYQNLGLSVKEESPGFRVKIKIKYAGTGVETLDAEEGDDQTGDTGDIFVRDPEEEFESLATRPRPKYKTLKKRFKAIRQAVDNGALPGKDVAYAFARASELMVTYQGKGDTHYADYTRLVREFLAALEDRDLERVREAVLALDAQEEACHDIYK
jgi:XXXCH domain-containing protein